MRKLALSLFVIAASGTYVWSQAATRPATELMGSAAPAALLPAAAETDPIATATTPPAAVTAVTEQASAPLPVTELPALPRDPVPPAPPAVQSEVAAPQTAASGLSRSAFVDVPLPRLRPSIVATRPKVTRVAATVAAKGGYADGTYTGPEADAYYGLIRIQAIVQGGQVVALKVLEYPSDRRTSVAINRQALPMLRDEVIAAQSARVDIISGATLTSRAFIESLSGALDQAGTSL